MGRLVLGSVDGYGPTIADTPACLFGDLASFECSYVVGLALLLCKQGGRLEFSLDRAARTC